MSGAEFLTVIKYSDHPIATNPGAVAIGWKVDSQGNAFMIRTSFEGAVLTRNSGELTLATKGFFRDPKAAADSIEAFSLALGLTGGAYAGR